MDFSLNAGQVFLILLLLIFIIISALISGSEVAFFALDYNDVKAFEEEDSIVSKRILKLKNAPRKLLATILITNNFINIAIVILSEALIWQWFTADSFIFFANQVNSWLAAAFDPNTFGRIINFLVTTVLATGILLLFGEIAPKVYANVNAIRLARFMATPLYFLSKLLDPISNLLVGVSKRLEWAIANNKLSKSGTSKEDIDRAIEITVKQDPESDKEVDILKSIVKFGEVTVKQIMKSRVDVTSLDMSSNYKEVQSVIQESGYSRIPVYRDDFDNIMGILYVKDLLAFIDQGENFDWVKLVRTDILYVPESKKINELLKEFQLKRVHMGIVVDEFGGSSGIVTLEDVMEEVIGDIKDEFDEDEEVEFVKLNNEEFIFEGKTLLNDACRLMNIPTETFDDIKGDADSIAGLYLEVVGHFPNENEDVSILGYNLMPLSFNRKRIEKIKIKKE